MSKETTSLTSDNHHTLSKTLDSNARLVTDEIKLLLERLNEGPLKDAAKFSCLETTGKKIRPFLFIETLRLLGSNIEPFISIGAAIEICHIYSLIHDDLPSIDNDDFRRGQPSCHKKFNEATALLTGDALLTYSFEIISNNTNISSEKRCLLISEFAKALGTAGMVGGQALDLALKTTKISTSEIINLHALKTGKLIEFACKAATIIASANTAEEEAIRNFAVNFGLIFQITDDLLDYDEKKSLECNIVSTLGASETKSFLETIVNKSILSLEIFGDKANILKSLVEFTLNRTN